MRIRYTRKSTEAEDRQAASHEQQNAEMDAVWGKADRYFADSRSGTTFGRPGFQEMLEFCRANKQGGVIEVYDYDRWGRPLDEQGRPEPALFFGYIYELQRLGWQVRFLRAEQTGNPIADFLTAGLGAINASLYSAGLSDKIKRGKRYWASKGAWQGGRAPWPTRIVERDGMPVLQAVRELLPIWQRGAVMLINGMGPAAVAREFNRLGVERNSSRRPWRAHDIARVYRNRALIGELNDGSKAAWGELVPRDLFLQAAAQLNKRKLRPRANWAALRPVCAHCGAFYYPTTSGKGYRQYVHGAVENVAAEIAERMQQAGCRRWAISADKFEQLLHQAITDACCSTEFNRLLDELSGETEEAKDAAKRRLEIARKRVALLQRKREAAVMAEVEARAAGEPYETYKEIRRGVEAELVGAQAELRAAELAAATLQSGADRAQEIRDEAAKIEDIWQREEKRKELLARWIDSVYVEAAGKEKRLRISLGGGWRQVEGTVSRSVRMWVMVLIQ